jgi:DNA replication protein DnaC
MAMIDAGKKEAAKRLEALLGGIRLGSRYRDTRFPDYHPTCDEARAILKKCQSYASTFDCRLRDGDNLLMLGNYGTGKNMLAACICNEVAHAGYAPLHTTIIKMLRRIKETWKKESKETEQSVIDSFILPDLLVVDEIGVQFGTESEKQLTFEALNGRSEEKKPTILISNLTDEGALSHYLGARVMDRVKEGRTGVLNFTWESYRGRKS